MLAWAKFPCSFVGKFRKFFDIPCNAYNVYFWLHGKVWASKESTPEDSEFPFQAYLWKSLCCRGINIHLFLALRPTTSPAAVSSSSPPHPSLNDSCFHSISPRVKKMIITHIDDQNIKAPVCIMIQEKWRISSYVHFATDLFLVHNIFQ